MDLSHYFALLQKWCSQDQLLAAYRTPGDNSYKIIKQSDPRIVEIGENNFNEHTGFAFHPYNHSQHPSVWIKADVIIDSITDDLPLESLPVKYDRQFESKKFNSVSKEAYTDLVSNLKKQMIEGQFEKIVYSRTDHFQVNQQSAVDIFRKLAEQHPDVMVYLVHLPGNISWVGATPETLLNMDGKTLRTMALAGTQKMNGQNLNEVRWSKKEIHEHHLVENEIEYILSAEGLQFQKKGPATRLVNNDILHLCSEYQLEYKGLINPWELVNKLHPTSAVCGLPRNTAKARLKEVESHDREYYTGFLGPVNIEDNSSLFVNLRCAKIYNDQGTLYVGGGLTADSDPEAEWEETLLKSRTIRNTLTGL